MKKFSFLSRGGVPVWLAFLLFFGKTTTAQILTGIVTDSESGEPLPFASVYLSNTTYATDTDTTGAYKLASITPGRYTLAARVVGYTPYYQTVTLQTGIKTQINIKLKADGRELAEVKVTAQRDKVWERQYQTFFNVFFGEKASAKACKIINPWVIELEEKGNTLTAKADQIIEIENRYLGYKVLYDLRSFKFNGEETFYSGLTSFQPLIAASATETEQWKANREKAFFGSEIHFFKNLAERKTTEAGYEAYVDKPGADPHSRSRFFYQDQAKKLTQFGLDTLVTGNQGTFQIRLPRRFELHSAGGEGIFAIYRDKPVQVSWIETTGKPLIFNTDGLLLNPQEWAVSGYLANLRMAETLPINYLASQRAPIVRRTGDDWIERPVSTTDQPYYRPGQNISLAGHMQYHNPAYRDSLSRLLRVALFHADKKPVYAGRWIVQEGIFQGQIALPDTLRPGMYLLRIHSEWMRNFADELATTQWIPIIGLSEKPLPTPLAADSLLHLTVTRRDTALQWRLEAQNLNLSTVSLSVLDEGTSPLAYPEKAPAAPQASFDFPQKINFPLERGITLSGRVEGKKDKASADAQVLLVVPRLGLSFVRSTDAEGRFRFSDLPIQGTQDVILKATNAKGKPAGAIVLDEPSPTLTAPTKQAPTFPVQPTLNPIKIVYDTDYAARAVQLNEVAVKAQRTPPPPKVYRQPDYTVQGKDIQNAVGSNFLVALQGRVPGLEIRETRDADGFIKLVIFIRGGTSAGFSSSNKNTPLFLVDGVPFEDINQISSISPASVERVEVLTRAEPMLGMRGYGGVISIFTKQGAGTDNTLEANDPSARKIALEGYTLPTDRATASLIWLPELNLDPLGVTEGRVPLLPAGQYRFVVEGFTIQGQRVRTSSLIMIE
ncbi:carboxypeptidase regulatory-like domain-containing protein [Salmonirosea aquatica]|uniref:TonB-dependent receptor plug domain-containing protein n=1 Tax=Salmonirosea aquatica TaxID=2654236 RepID=A0A7C9FYM2_9BACT|nr:TonB-dependent receptor plug domain-containing protein [Cytophagaceae bacterium SJW1-29]